MQLRIARTGGWAALIAGVLGAAAAVVLIAVPPGAPRTVFSYPLTPEGHLVAQVAFGVHHVVAAFALWAVLSSGLAGRSRFAAITGTAAAATFAAFGVWEIVVGAFGDEPYPSATTDTIDTVYGVLSLLVAVTLAVFGVAVGRAKVLGPVSRWLVLAFGVFLIVPGLPLLAAGFVAGRIAIALWLLILALLGVSMVRWAGAQRMPEVRRTTTAAHTPARAS